MPIINTIVRYRTIHCTSIFSIEAKLSSHHFLYARIWRKSQINNMSGYIARSHLKSISSHQSINPITMIGIICSSALLQFSHPGLNSSVGYASNIHPMISPKTNSHPYKLKTPSATSIFSFFYLTQSPMNVKIAQVAMI